MGIGFNDIKWWYFFILATVLLSPEIFSFLRKRFVKERMDTKLEGKQLKE
jgi:hypothetical protein